MNSSGEFPIKAVICEKGGIAVHPTGWSMKPFIKDGDTVVLKKSDEKIKVGDCVLFERSDGKKILHRVYETDGEIVVTRGDFETRCDEPISVSQILGVMTEYYSDDKMVSAADKEYIKKYRRWNGRGRSLRLFFYRGAVITIAKFKSFLKKIFKKKTEC